MPDHTNLLKRVRALAKADIDVDLAIWAIAVGQPIPEMASIASYWSEEEKRDIVPRYTSSNDAALRFVGRVLPGWWCASYPTSAELRHPTSRLLDVTATGKTRPLAILTATLLAINSRSAS